MTSNREAKVQKNQFVKALIVGVRNFRKYHNFAVEKALPILKPVRNTLKSLAEQLGLGKLSLVLIITVLDPVMF